MLEGVTFEQLRTLRAVAEAGSFSAAARKLGRVQAAVSQAIERLETQLGLRLFDRSGRVPRLTQHGRAVVDAAGRVERGIDALDELVLGLRRGDETRLSIVVDVLFPTDPLVQFATAFAREHPSVELVLFTEILSAVTRHVRSRQSTWGIAVEDADLRDLDRRPLAQVKLVPVAAPGYVLAMRRGVLDAADLADAVQIVLGEHRPSREEEPSDEKGVFSTRTWRVVDLATKHALVLGGLGWGHLPEHLVRGDLMGGRLVELALAAWGGVAPLRQLILVSRQGVIMGPIATWAQQRLGVLCREATAPAPSVARPPPPLHDEHHRG